MKASFDLTGRVAMVTGAARGLGYEAARALGGAGARVYVNGSDKGRAEEAVARLKAENIQAFPAVFDVGNEAAGNAMLDDIFAREGRFDIIVNNVGVRFRESLEKIGSDDLRRLFDPNVFSAFTLAKRAAAMMKKGGYGRIINISSVAAQRGRQNDAAYIMAKGAMNSMTIALAAELGQFGITCNAIMPGTFATETNKASFDTDFARNFFKTRVLLQRPGEPWEIGGAALFLASPAASFITGLLMPVDGGHLVAA
jgi:gluconate 5-dehydrogenase